MFILLTLAVIVVSIIINIVLFDRINKRKNYNNYSSGKATIINQNESALKIAALHIHQILLVCNVIHDDNSFFVLPNKSVKL